MQVNFKKYRFFVGISLVRHHSWIKLDFGGIKIPDPITVHDLVHRPKEINSQGILVDEALTVLREVIRQVTYGTVTDVVAMTFSDETNENKVQRL